MYNSQDENNAQNHYQPNHTYTPYDVPQNKKPNSSDGMGKIIAVALTCSLLGGLVGAAGVRLFGNSSNDHSMIYEGKREATVLDITQVDTSKEMTPAEVYAANVNSTVGITTTAVTTNFWGYQTTQAASGSGFIFSEDGYILTNHHVIKGATAVSVSMYDGESYDASLVGYDESNDIAVLKIEAENLTPVILGDSDTVNVGASVIAIGNPLGELTFSLTSGVVSALDREVTFQGGISMDLIQTDCAINSGNSGGALFNLHGEVIGITNAKYSSNSSTSASIDNIGFAIPMNTVRGIVESIIENGYISKPYLGISVMTVSEDVQSYGLPAGASVQEVVEDSPAEKAGLKVNDIITEVNRTDITTSDELVDIVQEATVGDELVLTVYRNGETLEITVTIGEKITSAIQEPSVQQSTHQPPSDFFPWGN